MNWKQHRRNFTPLDLQHFSLLGRVKTLHVLHFKGYGSQEIEMELEHTFNESGFVVKTEMTRGSLAGYREEYFFEGGSHFLERRTIYPQETKPREILIFRYDESGLPTEREKHERGKLESITYFLHDLKGRLIQEHEILANRESGYWRLVEYDSWGRISHDAVGFDQPDLKMLNRSEHFQYDSLGRVILHQVTHERKTNRHLYSYNAFNLLVREDWDGSIEEYHYTYDANGNWVEHRVFKGGEETHRTSRRVLYY